VTLLPMDVTDEGSVARVFETVGPLDALVNNAGIGWLNAIEGTPLPLVRRILETNLVGIIATMQAVMPQFRANGAGVIVNVTSTVTLSALPLLSIYTASKAAVNALTESFALEAEPLGVRARLVLPGLSPETQFAANARKLSEGGFAFPESYKVFGEGVMAQLTGSHDLVTTGQDVAEAVWRAVTDPSAPMRLYAGADAVALAEQVSRGAAL